MLVFGVQDPTQGQRVGFHEGVMFSGREELEFRRRGEKMCEQQSNGTCRMRGQFASKHN